MPIEITSADNSKLKKIRRLHKSARFRRQEEQFVVEGSRWIREAVAAALPPVYWLATAGWLAENEALAEELTRLAQPPLLLSETLLRETADTQTPAGVIAVLPRPGLPWPAMPTFLLFLDRLRDPGNVGTLLRSAAAAGVEGVILAPQTTDVFNPKVVRASMGAILRLPLREPSWSDIPVLTAGCPLVLADAGANLTYTSFDWLPPVTLMIGGEATGASGPGRQLADRAVAIPMRAATESLNAAVAGSIILFEIVRQRTR